jgi:hypothetical protein
MTVTEISESPQTTLDKPRNRGNYLLSLSPRYLWLRCDRGPGQQQRSNMLHNHGSKMFAFGSQSTARNLGLQPVQDFDSHPKSRTTLDRALVLPSSIEHQYDPNYTSALPCRALGHLRTED